MKRFLSFILSACLLAALCPAALAANESNIIPYTNGYDPAADPQGALSAVFTAEEITVDGVRDDAYSACDPQEIANVKPVSGSAESAASGTLYAAWDGPVLYLLAEVKDAAVSTEPAQAGPVGSNPAIPPQADSVTFGIDLWNDKVNFGTDTVGTFTVGADGQLYFFRSGNIASQSSVIADPEAPEYTGRLAAAAGKLTDKGYCVEAALHIEDLMDPADFRLGLEVVINDARTPTEEEKVPGTDAWGQPVITSTVENRIWWSHRNDSLYDVINDSDPRNLDWGTLTLAGWDGSAAFAFSSWRISNTIRFLDSVAFAKDVYTAETQARLDAARAAAQALLDGGSTDQAAVDAAADELIAALDGLRWADTKYPDPADLPEIMTLPDPYRFFSGDRTVETAADWAERRAEILDLAQFYEYGYMPAAPEKVEITSVTHFNPGDTRTILFWGFWPMDVTVDCPTDVVTISVTDGGKTASLEYTVYLPTEEQLAAAGRQGQKNPVLLSYDGDSAIYRNAGFVVIETPAGSGGDVRTNEYAWGQRTGAFYELYPYERNGEGALKEVSSEMAAAWAAGRVIDSLSLLEGCGIEYADEIASAADPENLAVTGFSINGKYAFVAAVFDERIDLCIPGAAGASGPSPWRYVYTGHEYDWTGTPFAPAEGVVSPAQQVSWGTETLGNSIRHNRVRETEVFRKFLTPRNFYKRLPGAWGYGARLPYDQSDLVATLAPRAILLVNTVNDYNDGAEADALGLEIAKSVYRNLGLDADALVKFNYRSVQDGDPHGTDDAQRQRTAEYMRSFFFGEALSAETDALLTDPFLLPVSGGASPFDTYYGGFNTITGGTSGTDGRDGWYYRTWGK